jgi:hypothetical protein
MHSNVKIKSSLLQLPWTNKMLTTSCIYNITSDFAVKNYYQY